MPGFLDPMTDAERKRLRAKADAMFGGPEPEEVADIELELPPLAICDAVQADEPAVRFTRDNLREMDFLNPPEAVADAMATIDHARRLALANGILQRPKLTPDERAAIVESVKESYRGTNFERIVLEAKTLEFPCSPDEIDHLTTGLPDAGMSQLTKMAQRLDAEILGESADSLLAEPVIYGDAYPVVIDDPEAAGGPDYYLGENVTVVGGRVIAPARSHMDDLPGLIAGSDPDDFVRACQKTADRIVKEIADSFLIVDGSIKPESYNYAAQSTLDWCNKKTAELEK